MTILDRPSRLPSERSAQLNRSRNRAGKYLGIAIAMAILAVMPFLIPEYQLLRLTDVAIAAIAATALCLLTGKAGQISIGTAAFMAVGAYASVALSRWFGIGFLPALLVAFVVGAIFGLALGLPTLRLRGFYLALTTLAFQFAVTFFGSRWEATSGHGAGFQLETPRIGGLAVDTEKKWYWITLAAAVICLWLMRNLSESAIGRAWRAIRDHEESAASSGIAAARYKILAFVANSAFTAFAGVLTAYHVGIVSAEEFTLDVTVSYIAMVIIGGLDSLLGAIVGAFIVTELPYWIQNVTGGAIGDALGSNLSEVQVLVYGAVIILVLILAPSGLMGLARQTVDRISSKANGLSAPRWVRLRNNKSPNETEERK